MYPFDPIELSFFLTVFNPHPDPPPIPDVLSDISFDGLLSPYPYSLSFYFSLILTPPVIVLFDFPFPLALSSLLSVYAFPFPPPSSDTELILISISLIASTLTIEFDDCLSDPIEPIREAEDYAHENIAFFVVK
jgi:hypothetical protein